MDSIQTKIDEEEIEESEIPFNDLPLEKQTEVQRSVREIVEREKKAINEQLKDAQTQMLEDLKKQEIEAQAKINERLRTAVLFIDQHLINAKDADIVKQFADILGLMKSEKSDSEHNLEWEIRLYATKNGIEMLKGNLTQPKAEKLPANTVNLSKKRLKK